MATESFPTGVATETAAGEAAGNAAGGIHVALSPEIITTVWGIPITNPLVTSWIVILVLAVLAIVVGRSPKLIPGRFQALLEWLFSFVYDYITETLGSREYARRFFPLLATMFLFIFSANLLGLFPVIGSVGFNTDRGFVGLFRGVNTDLNVTLMLALVAFFVVEITGIWVLGARKYLGKFITFHGHSMSERAINFFVGIVELFSELARIIAFSFRLFGNIFAGKVLLLVVMFFVPYFLPMPILAFELFVSFIQAVIFALLTLFFIKMAITEPHGQEAH